jgi:hypothetical protein
MQQKYGEKDLAVLAVSLDDPKDTETRKKVENLLAKLKPPYRTLNLAGYNFEKPPPTLDFGGGVPGVFVFNRDNRYALKLPLFKNNKEVEKYSLEAVDKAVEEAIKK